MEGGKVVINIVESSRENGSSSDGRPPIPISLAASTAYRQCLSSGSKPSPCTKSLFRHPSLVKTRASNISAEPRLDLDDSGIDFIPVLRSGAWSDIGIRSSMEDVHVCADNLMLDYGLKKSDEGPNAFYGVFDGHGGKHAADFACYHLPRFIVMNEHFPHEIERVISSAFLQTDSAFAEACSLDGDLASGTTALAVVVVGSSLVVANAGDCRAVLCRRGKAIEMSRDHKPVCLKERCRIEACGGYVYDGYLNGQLNVARALGDWHMEGLKHRDGDRFVGPLSAEPEFMSTKLTAEDEFLILGCDGIWEVFTSENAVVFARRRLQEHNDPVKCSEDLVKEALKRESGDNLAVVVVCFQQQPPLPNLVAPRGRVHRSISVEGLEEVQSFLDTLESSDDDEHE